MRIAKIMANTTVEGPGTRTAIWTQGCSLKCKGCINVELQDPKGGKEVCINTIVRTVKNSKSKRLTILGGEPLDQAPQIMALVYKVKLLVPGTTIMLFTGYETEQAKKLLGPIIWPAIDVIITGPYDPSKPDTRKWIGSTNQVIHRNTKEAKAYVWPKKEVFELEFSADSEGAYVNGL